MYKIERFLCKLKRYVRNKARAEGSIAEGYIIDECLTFCSMYLTGIETRFNREDRNDDGSSKKDKPILDIFSKSARPFGDGDYDAIPRKDLDMARWYVLNNCEEAESFLQEHKEELVKQDVGNIEEKHREQFPLWFKRKILKLYNKDKSMSIKKLYPLAMESDVRGRRHTGCVTKGVRYLIQRRDELRKSQNCGIVVAGYHENELIDFYGIITDIIELEYVDENRVFLFKCKWFDLRKKTGMQKDKHFTSICVKRFWYEHDSFVLATQEKQENSETESDESHIINNDVYQDMSLESNLIVNDTVDMLSKLHRDDVEPITLDANVIELDGQTEPEVEVDYIEEDSD
ncbi:uncharacterized protein LOC132612162 [Lycium barbarum]|uniref:uncharacterized protein LOC132612162 n=1 Tax=Lycium barbarum TaxID=112863 RepID=UPI00293F1C3E|nr:uncharacterized protein LOC132612162 [Lycium barbarum]